MDVDSSTSTNTADLEEPNLEQSEGEQLEDTGGAQSKDEESDTSRGKQSQDSYSQHSGESEQSEESDKVPPSRRRSRLLRRFIRRYDYPKRNPRRSYLLAVYHQLVAELGIIVVPEYLGKYCKANWTS
ncbi:hypothetical protein PtB15_1B658 [Puccinia triticina]|nr:hypothetical protein PtB15_1B658 [Puccinia triticina]